MPNDTDRDKKEASHGKAEDSRPGRRLLHAAVTAEFARRGITGHTQYVVDQVERDAVTYKNGHALPYDLLMSFPPYVAATSYPSLPSDDRGFIAADVATRQVVGHPDVYVARDAGQPFYAGLPWKGMEMSLKVISNLMAK